MAYTKTNDYTLCETTPVPGTQGSLTRWFNFASCTVTTLYREKAEMQHNQKERFTGSDYAVSSAVSVALSSQMQVQRFCELDSMKEVELLHKELVRQGGTPPSLDEILNTTMELRKDVQVGRALQLKTKP
jgi:hypothetical protein